MIYYQYRHDRTLGTLRCINELVARAEPSRPSPGETPVKRNRFIQLDGGSIEAHLTIVFAALAVSRWMEHQTGWSIRKFVRTARRYRIIEIQAGSHTIAAADPLPDDLRQALEAINGTR